MIADIITIGDEILIGQIVDTNSSWMAAQLELNGIQVRQITSISDDPQHIENALESALKKSDLVLITGGLGPTNDDITKHVLNDFFGDKLVLDKTVLSDVKTLFNRLGRRMNDLNNQQALVPSKCRVLRNKLGTAPGMWFNHGKKIVVSMPGVPFEMKGIMSQVIPMLREKSKLPEIIHKVVILRGIVESHLAELIVGWEQALPSVIKLAYLPSKGYIRLRFTARGTDRFELEKMIDHQIDQLKVVAGKFFCPYQVLALEQEVGELLKKEQCTIATAESCTGGSIAHRITSVPGSSTYFKGSVVAYTEEVKEEMLGVSLDTINEFGVVSEQVVEEMALGAQKRFSADYALATSGVAGPSGGTASQPVGTVCVALATPKGVLSDTFCFLSDRQGNILKATEKALQILKEILENK
ncbi:MAG: competence/damage-inducible protein A [Bacteroidetes bacterium]|nr:competence/damage-inducible protein A [Bacteroidota bacterium]